MEYISGGSSSTAGGSLSIDNSDVDGDKKWQE
jgi:hypothetical protein